MKKHKYLLIKIAATIGLALTCVQLFFHIKGQELCFNQGCQIVEDLLNLSPFLINGAGAIFFLIVIFLALFEEKTDKKLTLLPIVILSAFVCEGICIGIQIFIAKTFCSYCLIIASIIFLIGLFYNLQSLLMGLLLISLELFLFSHIKFPLGTNTNLNEGTYGVKTCSNPSSVAYLIFSQNCPHCKKVLENLKGCVKCEIHFNPISRIEKKLLPGVVPVEGYKPEVNILALKIFGINSVPVLIQRTQNGFKIIKGDEEIIRYISENCFCSGNTKLIPGFEVEEQIFGTQEGVCSITEECK